MTSRSISRSVLRTSWPTSWPTSWLICCAAIGCGSKQPAGAIDPPDLPELVSSAEQPGAGDGVDLVLKNARVITLDADRPSAEAIAIDEGIIIAVGSTAEIEGMIGRGTRVIDNPGTITPGLVDAHCHLYGLGVSLDMISLRDVASEADAVAAVKAGASRFPAGAWIVGRGWDQTRWPNQAWPTKASLDAAFPTQPVLLRRVDGHAVWANSAALAAAKITRATKDPAGGRILRDASGEPTGLLIDKALEIIDAAVPPPSAADRERRIRTAAQVAVAAGLVGVHEMGIEDETAAVYTKLAQANELPLRVYAYLDEAEAKPSLLERLGKRPAPPVGRFQMRGVKLFADGALGSRGARLEKPYSDDKRNVGLWINTPDELRAKVKMASDFGWQIAVHAIGDAAISAVLDAYADVSAQHPGDVRNRIEHAQVIDPEDLRAFQETRTIASMQPTHATSDMRWAEARVGRSRISGAYAWRTLHEYGVPFAAGSDFPVEDVPPVLGLYAAVTRQDASGNPAGGWYPAQKLTLDEALAGFTTGAAYAEFADATRGRIKPGYVADLTVFERPLAPDRSLLTNKVVLTMVDGAIVFSTLPAPTQPEAVR